MHNILIIIDEIEFKYFEFNKLVTNFWFVYEYLKRGNKVSITTKNKLYLKKDRPFGLCFDTYIESNNIKKVQSAAVQSLNDFDIIYFRSDPPVDINYINATYILSYIDKTKTFVINDPIALREKNEKLYVNEFCKYDGLIPDNIVSSDEKIIKEFLFEYGQIVLKPTNRCFGSGVFYLNDKDKNINTIISTVTENFKTAVMVQQYLPEIKEGDKRLIYVCGEIFEYCVRKVATNNDFKFNEHNKDTLKFTELTPKEKTIQDLVKDKFEQDGIYLAGLDVIDGKIIEINITSPCFFINEINSIFNIEFEKIIIDKIEKYMDSKSTLKNSVLQIS